jgi:aminoglycoside 6-adenylyltransferase
MDSLIRRITEWATTKDNIRAAVLLGSQARTERPADEWSDADISLFTTDMDTYLSSSDWLHEIEKVHLTMLGVSGFGGMRQWRVMFDGARDVELTVMPDEMMKILVFMLQADSVPPEAKTGVEELRTVMRRGVRMLVDKDGTMEQIASMLIPGEPPQAVPPTEKEFLNLVNDFWYHTIWVAKKLRRGELWTAKACLDGYLKWDCVLPMVQWHTKASHGWQTDIWHSGRFMEKWADQRVIEGLRGSFAHYDAADIARALLAQMESFREVAIETVKLLGYLYPQDADDYCSVWVKERLQNEV